MKYIFSSPVFLSCAGLSNSCACRIAAAGTHRMRHAVGGSSLKENLRFLSIEVCSIPNYIDIYAEFFALSTNFKN